MTFYSNIKAKIKKEGESLKELFTLKRIVLIVLGTALLSFGIYNIHNQTNITEGGVLGLILLINHWFGIPASIVSPVLDILCYALAFKFLGKDFIKVSIVSTLSLAGFFRLWEQFPPLLADLSAYPFWAAILGGLFVGIGVGIIVRQGGSSGGDDALALTISKVTKIRLSRAYLATDVTVLLLSLTYIPFSRIIFSFVTVTLSSYTIDFIENIGKQREREEGLLSKSLKALRRRYAPDEK